MQIKTEFKGKVYFFQHPRFEFLTVDTSPDFGKSDGYIYLGSSDEISVTFDVESATNSAIQNMEKAIEEEKAASLHRINIMRGQIQSLRALEHVA